MRKLASLRTIEAVHPIDGADRIEMVVIDGWQVVSQKGNFKAGDPCVYFEIDSIFPKDSVVGLSLPADKAGRYHTEENGYMDDVHRIKTIRLRGQISQGYALPLTYFADYDVDLKAEDLTKELGVLKYDKPESTGGGMGYAAVAGNFPTTYIPKTNQERAQNLKRTIYDHYVANTEFEVSVKLDGSSLTVGRVHENPEQEIKDYICSRNLSLKLDMEEDTSPFLIIGRPVLQNLVDKQMANIAIQGELVAPNIQKNFEGVGKASLYVYSLWNVATQAYYSPTDAKEIVEGLGLNYVPLIAERTTLRDLIGVVEDQNDLLAKLLAFADGPSGLNGKYREGLVYKSLDGKFSFKTISNKYLLKEA